MREPLVYCLEEADNGKQLHLISLPEEPAFTAAFQPDFLGGVTVVETTGLREQNTQSTLYANAVTPQTETIPLRFIPYYAWANRGVGEMAVWIRR